VYGGDSGDVTVAMSAAAAVATATVKHVPELCKLQFEKVTIP